MGITINNGPSQATTWIPWAKRAQLALLWPFTRPMVDKWIPVLIVWHMRPGLIPESQSPIP